MKKMLTFTLLLATLAFTGCGAGTSSSTQTKDSGDKTISRAVMDPSDYAIVAEDKFPASNTEYDKTSSSVTVYHSDVKEDTTNFKNRYKALTGKEYKKEFDGTMIVAKTGTKNNTGYTIKVENIEDGGRYTNLYLAVVKTKGCLVSQTITSPYTIAFVPNHKEVKFYIEEKVVECK